MMNGSFNWLRRWLDDSAVARLNEVTVSLSPSRRIGVADAACAWWEHLSKVVADLEAPAGDRSIWGAHDFVAMLTVRDAVAEGISQLDGELARTLEPAISDVDHRFREFTETDTDGCIERIDGRSTAGRGWWWARIPVSGPIRDEIQSYYGHASPGGSEA